MHSLRELYKIGRGPSSSHTMGPERAARDFQGRCPSAARYSVVLYGSLAHTGRGHLTDVAILSVLGEDRTEVVFDRDVKELPHPNTMTFTAYDGAGNEIEKRTYLSVGGGIIQALGEREGEGKDVYPFRSFPRSRSIASGKTSALTNAPIGSKTAGSATFCAKSGRPCALPSTRAFARRANSPGGCTS